MELLMETAKASSKVSETPAPAVLFLNFGNNSLDFELRVFIPDLKDKLAVISELHQEIDRRFRQENIEIAFPQLDLHLRTPETPVKMQASEPDR
jgi:potassium efflux system protein